MQVCPLCETSGGICFDQRRRVPIVLNRTYRTADEARSASTGDVAFTGCERCGFVWNAAFDERAIVYDAHYENDQAHSDAFRAHMQEMAQRALRMVPNGDEIAVVEVGAGQGVFLGLLAEAAGPRLALAAGFDPAWRGGSPGAKIELSSELFEPSTAERLRRPPNLLISRHTIEHVARPLAFLRTVRAALGNGAVRVAIETPCIRWIFENWAIQDLFFEHCSLFTEETLTAALNATGFRTTSVARVFGGQYLWAEAVAVGPTAAIDWSNTRKADFAAWHRRKDAMASKWNSFLNQRAARGPVYVWGAGAKGVTFASLFDPGVRLLRGLVDINPNKQGRFAPGSGAAIHAPAAIEPNATVVLMNPNYESEVSELCGQLGKSPLIVPFGELPPP